MWHIKNCSLELEVEPGRGPCLTAFLLVAHYDLLLGNGCLSGLGPCLIAFLLVAHCDLLLGKGCLSGLGPCLVAFSFHFGLVGLHFLAFWPFRPSFNSLHFDLVGLHFFAFWPCGPSFPCILALRAFISFHFGLFGVSVWGSPPTSCQKWPVCPTSLQWIYQRRDRLHFAVFSILGLHFLAFWPCGPSFPCILALWAFISLHFGLVGLHFLSFWPFRGRLLGPPPTSCQKWPVCPTSLQWIYQRRDRLHFAVFSILGLHFLAFWPCGPSFPCILALWAFISLHFGYVGLHFLAFWPCGPSFPRILAFSGSASGPPPHKLPKMARLPNVLTMDLSAPFRGQRLGSPPQVAKNGPLAQRPYNGFISAVTGSILQFLAFWAFISLHFGLVGLHFLAFWPCGPSFPCILALWAFISFHFGLFGVGFWAPPHKLPKMARLPNVLTMDLSAP